MSAPVNKSAEHANVQATRDASNQANARPVPGGIGSSGSSISATPAPDYYMTSSPSQGLGVYVSYDQAQKALNAMSSTDQEAIYTQAIKDTEYEGSNVQQAAVEIVRRDLEFAAEQDAGLGNYS